MTVAEQHLLLDTTNLALLLLGVSFVVHRLLASRKIQLPAGTHGKVATRPFELPELILALSIVVFFYALVRYPALRGFQSALPVLVLGVIVFLGPLRGNDLITVFGLERLSAGQLIRWSVVCLVTITLLTFLANWLWLMWTQGLIGPPRSQEQIQKLREDPNTLLPIFLQAALIAPLSEEVLFRGFLYPALKRYTQPMVAVVVVGAIFAAIHLHLPALFPLFVLSCLLIATYELSGSLWVPILVHAGFNAINIVITISGVTFGHGG